MDVRRQSRLRKHVFSRGIYALIADHPMRAPIVSQSILDAFLQVSDRECDRYSWD